MPYTAGPAAAAEPADGKPADGKPAAVGKAGTTMWQLSFALPDEAEARALAAKPPAELLAGVPPPQHGLSSNKMALITSDCDAMRAPEHQTALITPECAPFRADHPTGRLARPGPGVAGKHRGR